MEQLVQRFGDRTLAVAKPSHGEVGCTMCLTVMNDFGVDHTITVLVIPPNDVAGAYEA